MNIFVLDEDPVLAAQMLCDKHAPKMALEYAQLLCGVFPENSAPYKRTHYNHPCSLWARQSIQNYDWLIEHALETFNQYSFRFKREHKSFEVLAWCDSNKKILKFPQNKLTSFAVAMPEEFRLKGVVESYRNYYIKSKSRFAKWEKGVLAPEWYVL